MDRSWMDLGKKRSAGARVRPRGKLEIVLTILINILLSNLLLLGAEAVQNVREEALVLIGVVGRVVGRAAEVIILLVGIAAASRVGAAVCDCGKNMRVLEKRMVPIIWG